MRKLMMGLKVGLLVVGLLAMVATPAMAQQGGGIADPLTLAASGVLVPFFNAAAGDITFLEAISPSTYLPDAHMVFFNASCTRGDSRPIPMTVNDVVIFDTRNPSPNQNGLAAIASSSDGINLIPLRGATPDINGDLSSFSRNTGIWVRAHWINAQTEKTRSLEPIILQTAEDIDSTDHTWSPLRTGHGFFALPQVTGITNTIYLICPKTSIQGTGSTQSQTGGVFATFWGFPDIFPDFKTGYATPSIRGLVFDLDEHQLGDFSTDCDCVQIKPLVSMSTIYTDFSAAPGPTASGGSYTELTAEGPNGTTTDFAFTGYKAMDVAAAKFFGSFHRLFNASRDAIRGDSFVNSPGPR